MQKHHKHSHYIIANSEIVGLTPAERLLVAGISRYHRKATPDAAAHPEFEMLPKKDKATVWSLAAILRIADALDREHSSAVRAIDCRLQDGSLQIRARSRKTCRLETLGVTANAQMFRDHFGVDVALAIEREE
jgi:exopolyphosphatase/guanosine-5'-triphosphate,3'-diphosphate pyrophosphatase